jgi:predicted MFS family arabinose efflux permease
VLYRAVVAVGLLAGLALLTWLPRTDDLRGRSIVNEIAALRQPSVWWIVAVAALGTDTKSASQGPTGRTLVGMILRPLGGAL